VLIELSACYVDVEGKLKVKAQNSPLSGAFINFPSKSMILPHE
jgi:hypothetical protein